MAKSMRAAVYERTGPAHEVLALTELPLPEPAAGEVRVRLGWSGVNPSDVKSRAGTRTKTLPFPRIVPHSDGAGLIDAVGPGVDAGRVGERVWVWNAAWGRAFGTAAEYVVLPAVQAVMLPDEAPLEVGACLGIPALTAYHAVHVDGGVAGRNVLVQGGAGAVGHYAIQFARIAGAARVIATVSSEQKARLAREAGADDTLNYKDGDWTARCLDLTEGIGVDRIVEVDFAANVGADLAVLRPEGDIVVYGSGAPEVAVPFVPAIVKGARMRWFIVYNLTAVVRDRAVAELTRLLAAGALRHNIAAHLPLSRIAEAHELVERGALIGNVVISVV